MDIQKTFFSFEGRLNRKPYITYRIGMLLISGLFGSVVQASGSFFLGILGVILAIILFAGSISIIVKRLHDLDKSGLFALIMLIPLINFFFEIYLFCFKGTDGYNRFGEDLLQ